MKISYAISTWNEHTELERLLSFLHEHIDENDEIVVQCDKGNTTHEVDKVLGTWQGGPLKVIHFSLNGNFASFKNNLLKNCTGDWIFNIDADELPNKSLILNLKELLKLNPNTELILVPRVNTVEGITQEHINKWRWNVNEKGWVNWPDYQTRIIQNSPKIQWVGKVHEVITGFSTNSLLPAEEDWCLYHPKKIDKQEQQNHFYSTL
jgi:glycosyltransferase involved in cell wall biosynthesis